MARAGAAAAQAHGHKGGDALLRINDGDVLAGAIMTPEPFLNADMSKAERPRDTTS